MGTLEQGVLVCLWFCAVGMKVTDRMIPVISGDRVGDRADMLPETAPT